MKNVKVLFVVALIVAAGRIADAQQASTPDKEQIQRDQLRAAVQEICPVSGNKLGAHGAPVKAQIGQETVFLCCQGCLKGKVNAEYWATIHANAAKAQAKCPVMEKPLSKAPKWTIIEGQIVYICCPPCSKKIEADPKTFLQKVDELYAASLEAKRARR